ncbi:MAG: T9SS type A sorting domain-containing protein [Candidatus Cloacimonetes bacterium]|nr:T9SS type A sorting domain-containing protein [Candidatus Cloacimonadota bacterium]
MKVILTFLGLIISSTIVGQITDQIIQYRNDEYGVFWNRKELILSGNQIRTLFYNNGEMGQWPYQPSLEWPSGTGHGYSDGVTLLIAAEITAPGNGAIIHPLETSYREWMDEDPVTGEIWGMEPVAGYSNPNSDEFANSLNPESWPSSWPEVLPNVDESWDGLWYGYFGKGVINADYESFFVMDDSKDGEWARPPYDFFPIISDSNRKGLGLRVEVRNFVWEESIAEDIAFWHYDIVNLSDQAYDKTITGFYVDAGVGGSDDSGDDMANLDTFHDICYQFDGDGFGVPDAWTTGYIGFAFLESASNETNSIDDDEDGLVDESRNDGIDNDNDWTAFTDLNENETWDNGEPLNDDLGEDGIGPEDENYSGPDFGEGDGIPTHGEPNFDETDIDESDMIGLTSTSIYQLGDGGTGGGWPKDDESMWLKMAYGNFDTSLQRANISLTMGSGPYLLGLGATQRISTGLIFGDDLDDLILNKIVAQNIYNNNYRFIDANQEIPVSIIYPSPHDTVSGEINILWSTGDYSSENITTQIFLSSDGGETFEQIYEEYSNSGSYTMNTNDYTDGIFYKLKIICYDEIRYGKSETTSFFTINNSGNAPPQLKFLLPIQDDEVSNFTNIEFIAGDADGDSSKISLYYNDTDMYDNWVPIVQNLPDTTTKHFWNTLSIANGNHYYLFGKIENEFDSEIITSRPFVINNERNIIPGSILTTERNSHGTGNFYASVVQSQSVVPQNYKIEFVELTDSNDIGYNLINISSGEYIYENEEIGIDSEGPFFDGLRITIADDDNQKVIDSLTTWLVGNSNINIAVSPYTDSPENRQMYWEEDFIITYMENNIYTTPFSHIDCNLKIETKSDSTFVDYEIFDNDANNYLSLGDDIILMYDAFSSDWKLTWEINYNPPLDPSEEPILPVTGDKYQIVSAKKFVAGDFINFSSDIILGFDDKDEIVHQFKLSQNYPNPFNPTTTINYSIPQESFVKLKIYDILGREVETIVNEKQNRGNYQVRFDASKLSSGVYFYRIEANNFSEVKKMLLVK